MSTLSGWCQPGPIGSIPPHANCHTHDCPCDCHDDKEDA